jgi:hypothetical protein
MTYRNDPQTGETIHCELCAMFPATMVEEFPGGAIDICERCAKRRSHFGKDFTIRARVVAS